MEDSSGDIKILQIKEEGLDIKTRWVTSGEVRWYKNVITETRNITVPVKHEELVIEKRHFAPDSGSEVIKTETLRIPLREEKPEIKMVPFDLQEVTIYKQPVKSCRKIKATLQKEVLTVKNTGQGPETRINDID